MQVGPAAIQAVLIIIIVVLLFALFEQPRIAAAHLVAISASATSPPYVPSTLVRHFENDQCTPSNFSWSHELLSQWEVSRTLLGISTLENDCDTRKQLAAYLAGEPRWLGLESDAYGGIMHTPRGLCSSIWRGRRISYVRIYKGANDAICKNIQTVDDGSSNNPHLPPVTTTFVRHPIAHFVSGYSEIAHRAKSHPQYKSYLYSFMRPGLNESAAAEAFLRDFVSGALHRVHEITDAHVFPQVAFLAESPSIDFLGSVDDLVHSWGALGENFIQDPDWPPFDLAHSFDHTATDVRSGNAARQAMEDLLAGDGSALEAVCRILLPDFVCFRYPLPSRCKEKIGTSHGVTCPNIFPQRT